MSILRVIRRFVVAEDAATAVEYAVMLAMILVAVIGAVTTLGVEAGGWWGGIDSDLQTHVWNK